MKRAIVTTLLCWSLAACGTDPSHRSSGPPEDSPATTLYASVGDTLRLHPGQAVEVGAERFRIVFQVVSADSRCPRDVTCVWAGNATVRLAVAPGQPGATTVELHTHEEPKQAQHGGYTIVLLDVEPYPESAGSIRADQYRAVLVVTRP